MQRSNLSAADIDAIEQTASDIERAAALVGGYCSAPSSETVRATLLAEAKYLRNGDLAPLADADGVLDRYISASLASRRQEVYRYASDAGIAKDSPQLASALYALGATR